MSKKREPKSTAAAVKKSDPNMYRLREGVDGVKAGMTDSQAIAALVSRSSLAATSIKQYANAPDDLQVYDLLAELRQAGGEVSGGNLARVEKMLVNQAVTLDTLFHSLLQRAGRQEYMKNLETYMRLALKAQAQARSTAETLGLLKNPAPYIKQANIAAGHQQVNNHTYAGGAPDARAGNHQFVPSELLGASHGEWLDTGAASKAGRGYQAVETVGAVDRA